MQSSSSCAAELLLRSPTHRRHVESAVAVVDKVMAVITMVKHLLSEMFRDRGGEKEEVAKQADRDKAAKYAVMLQEVADPLIQEITHMVRSTASRWICTPLSHTDTQ
jgi:hypothetical protein